MYVFVTAHAELAQLALFFGVLSTLWLIEHVASGAAAGLRLRHLATNLLFVITALPIELALGALCLAASHYAAASDLGLSGPLSRTLGPVASNVVVFVALDLLDYLYHRAMHKVPALWRFHLVHHTDPEVDCSTTIREHPGETLVRGGALAVWTLLLGVSFEVLLLRQAAETVSALVSHSAVRLPDRLGRWLGLVFVTPNLHHVHHHCRQPFTDCNFGGVFSVWDRLFATFAELSEKETIFGLDTHEGVQARLFGELMAMPFRGEDDTPVLAARPAVAIDA